MIRSVLTKEEYEEIYQLLDTVSPVNYDCGELCGAACCQDPAELPDYIDDYEDFGMALLPGEDKVHDKHDPWLTWTSDSTDELDYPDSWQGRVWFAKCHGPENCKRSLRPIQCRTFPAAPHIDEEGRLYLVLNDMELPYKCPLLDFTEGHLLDETFLRVTYAAWKKLITDPLIYDLVKMDSEDREIVLIVWEE